MDRGRLAASVTAAATPLLTEVARRRGHRCCAGPPSRLTARDVRRVVSRPGRGGAAAAARRVTRACWWPPRHGGAQPFDPTRSPLLPRSPTRPRSRWSWPRPEQAQRQLDVLADRDRIARDLHDHVIQRLFATGLQLQSTLRARRPTRVAEAHRAGRRATWTRPSARSAPRSSTCTPRTDDTGLRRRLLDTAAEAARFCRLAVVAHLRPDRHRGAQALASHAVAVVREAISNAVRHGHAARSAHCRRGGRPDRRRARRRRRHPRRGRPQWPAQPGGPGP